MSKWQSTIEKQRKTARQLKLCSIVLIVYLMLIIVYILAIKSIKQRNAARFGNEVVKRKFVASPKQ
jgi:cytoskeletal protein RodZ